jgi:hypothetical protein
VPQPVAEAADFAPGNVRAKVGGGVAELGRCLADDQQGVFDGEGDLIVCREGRRIQAFGELLDATDILDDIREPLNRIARRHARPRDPRSVARAA